MINLSTELSPCFCTIFVELNLCPIQAWKLYTSKLNPDSDHLWQCAKLSNLHYIDEEWYDECIVRKDQLERYMKLSLMENVQLDGN